MDENKQRAEFEAAINEAYPVADTPHTSVRVRNIEERHAFKRGWDALAALALTQHDDDALSEMEKRKDAAYYERNQVVAALAQCFPSGKARTAIEGWSEDWHGCVYIDLPTGQVSWHYHDSHAHLFNSVPHYLGAWDGHDTDEKYRRVAALRRPAETAGAVDAQTVLAGVDLAVIARSYDWTIDQNGALLGLVAGDMGYEPTGITLGSAVAEILNAAGAPIDAFFAATPPAATTDAPPEPARAQKGEAVEINREGSKFWHNNCTGHFKSSGMMKEISREEGKSLFECLHCGKCAYYPVGRAGVVCADEILRAAKPNPEKVGCKRWCGDGECVKECADPDQRAADHAKRAGSALGREVLTEFIEKCCAENTQYIALAESMFYWFNKNLTERGQQAGDALDAARWQYIEDHATSHGGGRGFTITCWVPVDHEDMGCGIDEAIARASAAKGETPP